MNNYNYEKYASLFKVFSDETRLKLCCLVADEEICGGELLSQVDITQPTLSYHMKLLCSSGIVNSRKDGAWTRYTINHEKVIELEQFLKTLRICEQE